MTREDELRIEGYYVGLQVLKDAVNATLRTVEEDSGMTKGDTCAVVRACVDLEADFAAHQLTATMPPDAAAALQEHFQPRPKV